MFATIQSIASNKYDLIVRALVITGLEILPKDEKTFYTAVARIRAELIARDKNFDNEKFNNDVYGTIKKLKRQ